MQLPLLEPPKIRPADLAGGPRSIASVRMLRVSLTDRCNFRCTYCMPAEGVKWLEKSQLLTSDEIEQVVRVAAQRHGVTHIKLTGGEPTLRPELLDIIRRLRAVEGVKDLSLTTNGFALKKLAVPLRQAGLDRVTISLDSLRPDRFRAITRTGDLPTVLAGLDAALEAGFISTKLNCVVVKGTNDDEVVDFARLTLDRPVTVRFIEYMPMGDSVVAAAVGAFEAQETDGRVSYKVAAEETGPAGGCGAQERAGGFLAEAQVRERIERELGPLLPVERTSEPGVGPAVPWMLEGAAGVGGRIGFISAMSRPFCDTCNRLRLTATGVLRSCLFEGGEIDLLPLLRGGSDSADALAEAMVECVAKKPDVHSAHGNIQMSRIGG